MDKLRPTGCVCSAGKFPLGPELRNEKQRAQVRQALDNGENVQAKVTVTATDAAGNVATAKRTITLVKCGATSGRIVRRSRNDPVAEGYRAEWKGRLGGPSRYRVRDVTAALKAAGLRE